jgi:hypothetical protein
LAKRFTAGSDEDHAFSRALLSPGGGSSKQNSRPLSVKLQKSVNTGRAPAADSVADRKPAGPCQSSASPASLQKVKTQGM